MRRAPPELRNSFALSEWAGAVGDLGIMLPLAFALVIFNGYSPHRLFIFWGLVYIVTGWYYRVPVSVQPLKAMAVIALAAGYGVPQLASAALYFGLLMIVLSVTGIIRVLERFFTPALVRGVQLSLGLILFHKAVTMIRGTGPFIGWEDPTPWINAAAALMAIAILVVLQFRLKLPASLILIVTSIIISALSGIRPPHSWTELPVVGLQAPDPGFLWPALIYLMIPQLPLTLGNAVYAACDACRSFWPDRSERIEPTRFGLSIGISNVLIGLGGGFPICHGAGGIVAHQRFGGRTGGTTILIGGLLVVSAVIEPVGNLLFFIPVPLLGALLIITSWGLMVLLRELDRTADIIIAIIVGSVSFVTRNLTVALITGIVIEYALIYTRKRISPARGDGK